MSKRSASNGGEGGISIRTRMTQFLFVGLVYQDWSEGSMVVHPFRLGASAIRRAQQRVYFKILEGKHLLETAYDWQAKRALNPIFKRLRSHR